MSNERPKLVVLYPTPDEHEAAQPATVDKRKSCLHDHVSLDPEARTVTCGDCGGLVDPFTLILKWAKGWERLTRWQKEAERRRKLAQDRLAETLRLEKNAKARLRRVDPKARPPKPGWDEQGEIF